MARILNLGFHTLTPDYIAALRKLTICSEVDFTDVRTRSFVPMMTEEMAPDEVISLCKTAVTNAAPELGDVIVTSGIADVVAYVYTYAKDSGAHLLCPLGRNQDGKFRLRGFRELLTQRHMDLPNNGLYLVDTSSSGRDRHEDRRVREERVPVVQYGQRENAATRRPPQSCRFD